MRHLLRQLCRWGTVQDPVALPRCLIGKSCLALLTGYSQILLLVHLELIMWLLLLLQLLLFTQALMSSVTPVGTGTGFPEAITSSRAERQRERSYTL